MAYAIAYDNKKWIKGKTQTGVFLRTFFIAFLYPAEGSNAAGHSLTLTQNNPASVYVKIRRNPQLRILPLTLKRLFEVFNIPTSGKYKVI